MPNNKLVKNDHGYCHSDWLNHRHKMSVGKMVVKENFTSNPSSNIMNYAKFTTVMAGSDTLKQYLKDQKILPTSAICTNG